MPSTDIENSVRTKQPTFWDKFYWGTGCGADDISVKNRDIFYDAFHLIHFLGSNSRLNKAKYTTRLIAKHHNYTYLSNHQLCPLELCDHSEYYEIKKSKIRIILFHPYYISPENVEKAVKNGFVEIIPMYSSSARSFMKMVDEEYLITNFHKISQLMLSTE